MIQEILAGAALVIAVGFLVRKFFFKRKRKQESSDCGNCAGH
ncbi:FeoB-associated Cys-rich membrane protein [Flavobacterium ardleyense]